ncbi:MAG: polyribonucleotide nucleotidyltransferase [Patescibacteria group bacterium]
MTSNSFDIKIGDQIINLEANKLAPQTNASVVATYGNTKVLATVVMGRTDQSRDYFPLSVEFVDKLYAGGLVKGGKWVKREGGPSDNAILFGRIIDRSVRPLFPDGFMNEVQIVTTVLSNDKEHDIVLAAFTAASAALAISDIPFNSAVSAVRVGLIEGKMVINPALSHLSQSSLDLLVCTGPAGVNMIEADAQIVDNEAVLNAIEVAKDTGEAINKQILEFAQKYGKKKVEFIPVLPPQDLIEELNSKYQEDIKKFLENGVDGNHMQAEHDLLEKITQDYKARVETEEEFTKLLTESFNYVIKKHIRQSTLDGQRYDKRAFDEIRPLQIEAGILPSAHGSALFQRGLTQALTITTLSSLAEKQYLQDSTGETTKRYIHYYSAMPFSTGEAGRFGRPGRREVGHGALAEKALAPVIPSEQEFPYTIILTSEVLSQNGSSSMASTCGSTLSLMDAGVPIKDKVAGISIGMMSDDKDNYVLLTDIAGVEDHNGDMDFKITGTRTGITAIQLDIKRMGLTMDMIKATFEASTKARFHILDEMEKVLSSPRPELSPNAPKISMVRVPEEKIGEIIGSGGKTIKGLMEKYGVEIEVDDEGITSISSLDPAKNEAAAEEIRAMIKEVEIGEEYAGVVTRVENYGAFIEFLPGREALLHVSEMSGGFIADPSSIIKIGDKVDVKISGFNDNHQIKLSAPQFKADHPGSPQQPRPAFDRNRTSYGRPPFRPKDRRR